MPMLQKMWHVFSKQLDVANGGIVIVELAHFIKAFVEIIKIRESFFNKPDFRRITMIRFRLCAVTHLSRLVTMDWMINWYTRSQYLLT